MEFTNAQEVLSILENSIGKKCNLIVTGMMVEGRVLEVTNDKYSITVWCEHSPVRWG